MASGKRKRDCRELYDDLESDELLHEKIDDCVWDAQQNWRQLVRDGDYEAIIRLDELRPDEEPGTFPHRGLYVYYAPTMAGKTRTLMAVVYHMYDAFDDVYVWAKNEWEYAVVQPDDDKRFRSFGRGKRCMALLKALLRKKQAGELADDYEVCFVIDDQIDEDGFHGNKALDWLASYGRHLHITAHITTQRPTRVGPLLRCNTRVAALYQADTETSQMYYNDFSGTVRDRPLYRNTIDWYTRNYGVVFFHRNDKSGLWQRQFRCWNAPEIAREQWENKLVQSYGDEALREYREKHAGKYEETEEIV